MLRSSHAAFSLAAVLILAALVVGITGLAFGWFLVGGAVSIAGADEKATEGVTWLTDIDAARAEARKTGRPILAVFR